VRRALVIGVAAAAAIAVAVPVTLLAVSSPADSRAVRGSRPPATIQLPRFLLDDQAGNAVSSNTLRGKAAAVTFLDTKCRESCPIIADQIRQGLALLSPEERADTVAVAITVQPDVDTPAAVRSFLQRHRVADTLHYLTGTEPELRTVWNRFQVLPVLDGSSDIHSAPVRIYDRRGVWLSTLNAGADLTPANLAHDVGVALKTGD
jgi:protein SCO1